MVSSLIDYAQERNPRLPYSCCEDHQQGHSFSPPCGYLYPGSHPIAEIANRYDEVLIISIMVDPSDQFFHLDKVHTG